MSAQRKGGGKGRVGRAKVADKSKPPEPELIPEDTPSLLGRLASVAGALTWEAVGLAQRSVGVPFSIAKALLLRPDQLSGMKPERLALLQETGAYLKDLREVAGLTRDELSDALDLDDSTVLEAVEKGTATLSFELILRLAALLARHDPVPFIIRTTRAYNPALWQLLMDWGIGRLPLHFERERQFINVYRRYDMARELSDEGFERVLAMTQSAFDLALAYAADAEGLGSRAIASPQQNKTGPKSRAATRSSGSRPGRRKPSAT